MASNVPAHMPSHPPSPGADVMNDTEYATNTRPEDADTCRICRGEGTPEEPLFYPCKCSGSIKFVHQECLMEWLSHSQKKYCELCKTSFRFTKLYSPHMPQRIPTAIFFRRAAVHVLKNFITACRFVLVTSVWLILLPWCMRVVWRSLFWVGDGGWAQDFYEHVAREAESSSQPWDLDTIRSAIDTAKAANTSVALPLPTFLMPFSQTLNFTAGEPTAWSLIKRFFFGISYPLPDFTASSGANSTGLNTTSSNSTGFRNPSLLSDVTFFNWFPSPAANRFVVDVFEGQLITLLVVVAFILIFLIREWVVQQQPVINMVALGDHAAANQPAPMDQEAEPIAEPLAEADGGGVGPWVDLDPPAEGAAPDVDQRAPRMRPARIRRSSSDRRHRQALFRALQNSDDFPEELRRAIQDGTMEDVARVIERMPREESIRLKEKIVKLSDDLKAGRIADPAEESTGTSGPAEEDEAGPSGSADTRPFPRRHSSLPNRSRSAGVSPQRPNMPQRDRSFIATEIRRNLEEGETWSFSNIPKAEDDTDIPSNSAVVPDSWEDEGRAAESSQRGDDSLASDGEQDSEHSSESWQQVPDIVATDDNTSETELAPLKDKGKGRAVDEPDNADHELLSGSPAPPLANNTHNLEGPSSSTEADEEHGPEGNTVTTASSVCGSDSYREDAADLEEQPLPDSAHEGEQDPEPEVELDAETEAEIEAELERLRRAPQPRPGIMDRIVDWIWGDIAPGVVAAADNENDEFVVQNLDEEPPFVPFAANDAREQANEPGRDPEVAAAAAQAGIDLNDQDAIDDAEDLEGILELIGMQGPLTGLFQNAMFSAVLISATLACAVWFPYLSGKVVLLFMGSPISLFIKLPLQFVAAMADLGVDLILCAGAGVVWAACQLLMLAQIVLFFGKLMPTDANPFNMLGTPARSIAQSAMDRIAKSYVDAVYVPHPDYFRLSINSHAALRTIQNTTSQAIDQAGNALAAWYDTAASASSSETILRILAQVPVTLHVVVRTIISKTTELASWLWTSKSYSITLDFDLGLNTTAAATTVEQWSARDRLIAVFAGYAFFAVAGALYLKRAAPISTSQQGRRVEGIITEVLQQAGGVLKVILIISIEMLAFPLYCGLLLDFALLPLFDNASIWTRWEFTRGSPWTSGFVHWFIGTCYMFHFALFVSMCRKIMRRGVLYFIRDPDDPTFHPVRDVLERSVATQLRKIAFSALVYGALVIVCLGGVVWSLDRFSSGITPIHWASQAPSLEFPLDLLFYNFLTPLIIKVYKPSDGLQKVYKWWFRGCARYLRLSHFLFGERSQEEEGHHVRRSWSSWFAGEKGDVTKPVIGEDRRILQEDRGARVYFMFDGKYVRAPASDQVRIPKGTPVFVEVDAANNLKDGKTEDSVVHASNMVTMVYIPPWFRVRIAAFVFTIWMFAAATGIGFTVVPLQFGRYLFSLILPPTVEMNDIHAFSLGIYTLGTLAYAAWHVYKLTSSTAQQPIPSLLSSVRTVAAAASKVGLRALRFGYVWTSLVVLIPILFALLLELYILIPLHAYIGPKEPHVVHLIQDWTLGFLYARLAARVIFSNRASRPARAFSAVIADGYTNPNAKLASRCFVLPVLIIFGLAVLLPSSVAWTLNRTIWLGATEAAKSQVWRFSYPALALGLAGVWGGRAMVQWVGRWRMVVRDEVYLIGERLHNFGEKRAAGAVPVGRA